MKPAIILFTTAGSANAARIAALTGGRVHACGPEGEGASELLPRLFADKVPIVGICAAGILIRILAPHLRDKHDEPPVIAVSSNGQHVVPLLGGHHGANAMAREIADTLGGTAAVTTASDGKYWRGLDEPPHGYALANPDRAKSTMAAALNGKILKIEGDAPWIARAGYEVSEHGTIAVRVTEKVISDEVLTYHPRVLVAGIGCERGTGADELIGLISKVLRDAGLAAQSLAALATIDLKADEAAMHAAAQHFGVPLRLFSADELAKEAPHLPNPSKLVLAETGTPGVAEAAALKVGKLVVEKHKSKRATCAIGQSAQPIDPFWFGRGRGAVHIVGIGPGEADQRTAAASRILAEVDDWVGYGLYLDLISDLKTRQTEHRFDLGDEEKRVRHALELAADGKTVALVSSGDAQIYAMAALAFELLDAEGARALTDNARRVAIESHPGISAFQMASARAGAMIGHDFCCISLSDLLTPRDDILQRLDAAARGDFVTALYNPRSKRRTELIEVAVDGFRAHRPADTPVIVASNLGRTDEQVTVTTLAQLDVTTIDMLTIVMIGSSQSRAFRRGDGEMVTYTPRGYAKKSGAQL